LDGEQVKIGKANIEFLGEAVPFAGKPMTLHVDAPEEQLGTVNKFRVTTTDQLDYVFGIVQWPNANPEVIFFEDVDGESKYESLTHAGRLGILPNFGDFWLLELRAMKYNQEAKKTNLAGALIENLDKFVDGDAEQVLKEHGALAIGTREELVGETNKKRNQLAMTCKVGDIEAVAVAFTITRVLAIMKDYGHNH
jgi:hypothetical protein